MNLRLTGALVSMIGTATIMVSDRVYAQSAVIGGSGCGTGCAVSFTQLGPVRKVSEGVFKVLTRVTITLNPGAFEQQKDEWIEAKTTKRWKFADCNQHLFGEGFSSDINGVEMRTIYDEQGNPEHRTFSNNIYSQWEALCTAGRRL